MPTWLGLPGQSDITEKVANRGLPGKEAHVGDGGGSVVGQGLLPLFILPIGEYVTAALT